jgi:L-amino acid N-acyltransferase YncA
MTQLVETARTRGLKTMAGDLLADNQSMLALAEALGFEIGDSHEGATVKRAVLTLT